MNKPLKFLVWFPVVIVAVFVVAWLWIRESSAPGPYDLEPVSGVRNREKIVPPAESYKTFHQEIGLYQVSYPANFNILSGSGESVGVDTFGLNNKSGGIDPVFSVFYFSENYGAEVPAKVLSRNDLLLGNVGAQRLEVIEDRSLQNKEIWVQTKGKVKGLTYRVELENINYQRVFDHILSTFKFLE